ncbi:MAG: methanogenesis marker protein Mmp4/MtxX [Methanobacteriaceae archaeon]|nr:methanogenesis marker protein Mmp4/MtxX [Methanobacteriaceae archaeon]
MRLAAGMGENRAIKDAINIVDFDIVLTESEDELIDLLLGRKVDAVVRGSLNASGIMNRLRSKYPNLCRASVLEVKGRKFLLAPVGIDEGDNLQQKEQIINQGASFMLDMGIKPRIGILSGGRPQDRGRSTRIDDSLDEAEELTRITMDKYPVKHYFILIEDALADGANLIMAPDGICGNLIFRSLVFLGSGKSYGAITLGIKEIFIDTSRSQNKEGYIRALKLAAHLVNLKNNRNNLLEFRNGTP